MARSGKYINQIIQHIFVTLNYFLYNKIRLNQLFKKHGSDHKHNLNLLLVIYKTFLMQTCEVAK